MPRSHSSNSSWIKGLFFVIVLSVGFIAGQFIDFSKLENLKDVMSTQNTAIAERSYIGDEIVLPEPEKIGLMSVEEAMQNRRSRRAFTDEPLTLKNVSQILWALQGQTADWGGRTVPSAKSAYPLQVTLVAQNVVDLPAGVYHFFPATHSLRMTVEGVPADFAEAAVQGQNKSAPAAFIISGDLAVMTKAFDGVSHDENVTLEAGHAGQNAYLQVESLGLGTVVSGGFNHELMQQVLRIPSSEELYYLIPVGVPMLEEPEK